MHVIHYHTKNYLSHDQTFAYILCPFGTIDDFVTWNKVQVIVLPTQHQVRMALLFSFFKNT